MTFNELRALWERILISSTHSVDRAPLVLDEQERSPTPAAYDPGRGGDLETCLGLAGGELLKETAGFLDRFLRNQVCPDGRKLWRLAKDFTPDTIRRDESIPLDADWLIAWFARQLLDESSRLRPSYLDIDGAGGAYPYSRAERVEFLRCLSCAMCYVLRAMVKGGPDPVSIPAPLTELEFGNALLYLVAEYVHVDLGITRRLSIEKCLRSLLGAETGLYLTEDFYRDHTFHMVYVGLLGDFLLQCYVRDEPLGCYLHRRYSSLEPTQPAEMLRFLRRNWYMAALYHDLGYALALLTSVEKLTEFLVSEQIDAVRNCLRQACVEGTRAFCEQVEQVLLPDRGFEVGEFDHGVASAVHLEHLLRKVIRDDDLATDLRPAVCAIARHNLTESTFRVGPMPSGSSGAQENEPLSFLLVLCDEIQEWGRVRVDPLRYREEVAAKTQFGGENPFITLRILYYLVVSVQWRGDRFAFVNDRITFDLVYRPLKRVEESYLAIWLLRTRNLQRVLLSNGTADAALIQIDVNSHWKHVERKASAPDDLEVLSNYVRNNNRWELHEWLTEARGRRQSVSYVAPQPGDFGCFTVDVNRLAGSRLLPVQPDLADIFTWLRSYPARLWART